MSTERSLPEQVDVLVIGAGLSGIGMACHLTRECPDKSFAIVEMREAIGGTWDLFRYPGIRSDSDMFTLGYDFKPWPSEKGIAAGADIRHYVEDAAREHDVERHIHFGHKVLSASWSTQTSLWTVQLQRTADDERVTVRCSFLHGCTGYYDYDTGFCPQFAGSDSFTGEIVHPQHWPDDLDLDGRRVVVIGSGATAVTLVPALAERGAHVTMLQRSPTYVISQPAADPLARALRRVLPDRLSYPAMRWKNVLVQMAFYNLSRKRPGVVKRLLRKQNERLLPDGIDVDVHFKPTYNPWDQRICLVPDGDLFRTLREGEAEIVTDHVERFDATGVQLRSGRHLDADVIVTATGLNLVILGHVELEVDGRAIDPSELVAYKGMMFSGVPNLALTVGYTNASWTLKADLVSRYVCRLLQHMDATGATKVTPLEPGPGVQREPFMDLKSGYVERVIDQFPKQGSRAPWRLRQNYVYDIAVLRRGSLEDEGIEFSAPPARAAQPRDTEPVAA